MPAVRPLLLFALLMGAGVLAGPAMAQRNGDVRNGFDNQPTKGEVRSRENAADVALSPQGQAAQTGRVDTIYQNLMGKENRDGLTSAPTSPTAPMMTTAPLTTRRPGRP